MNKILVSTLAIACLFLGFLGGTVYGFGEGAKNFRLLEGMAKGVLSSAYVKGIESGRAEQMIYGLELDVDSGLHSYVTYKKSGNRLLSEYYFPESASSVDSYVSRMVEYRKEHPVVFSPDWALPVEGDDERTRKWRAEEYKASVKMLEEIDGVIACYQTEEGCSY